MQSARGNLIYTVFATVAFTVIQYIQGTTEPLVLLATAAMFFVFTFFMLRLINRVMTVVGIGVQRRRAGRHDDEKGPAVVEATTARPEHVRRRRERRGRRGRR